MVRWVIVILGRVLRAWFRLSVISERFGGESGRLQSPCTVLGESRDEDIFGDINICNA